MDNKKDADRMRSNYEWQLVLWLTKGLQPSVQKQIIEKYPDLNEFFALNAKHLQTIGFHDAIIKQLKSPNWCKLERILDWHQQPNHHLLFFNSKNYPFLLKQISSPPMVLMAKGRIELLDYSQIAIIGSRNPSRNGLIIAKESSQCLSAKGLVVTSGFAMGIDAAAHEGALQQTIAVLGTGIDIIYPRCNHDLVDKMQEKSLFVSEFPLKTQPHAKNFPRRNRIISGLSLGTFVVEAALRSGSLITARNALEQGRDVFAMPNSVDNPMAKGCHWLLKQGAILVESAQEIWQHLQHNQLILNKKESKITASLDFCNRAHNIMNNDLTLTKAQYLLLDVLGYAIMTLETLVARMKMPVEAVSIILTELEIMGLIETIPGGVKRIHAGSP